MIELRTGASITVAFTCSHARQSVGDFHLNPRSGERGYDSI